MKQILNKIHFDSKNAITILFLFFITTFVLIIGFSYAYYLPQIEGEENTSRLFVKTINNELKITGVTSVDLMSMIPGDRISTSFKITNISNNDLASYQITFTNIKNTFVVKSEIKYQLLCYTDGGNVCKGVGYTSFPSVNDDTLILTGSSIDSGETHNFVLTVLFYDTGSIQNYNTNKALSFKINVGTYSDKLVDKLLEKNEVIATSLDYSSPSPSEVYTYYINRDYNSSIYSSSSSGDKLVGKNFSFDKTTGVFSITDYVSNVIYSNTYQNYYTCNTNAVSCTELFQLVNAFSVSSPNAYVGTIYNFTSSIIKCSQDLSSSQTIDQSLGIYSSAAGNKTVGKGYKFNGSNYVLNNIVNNAKYSNYTNYYTCDTTETTCTKMYKILTTSNVIDASKSYITKADVFTIGTMQNDYVSDDSSGLYSTSDQDGTTYYFRGKIINNYVSFANKIWRIMRINGDGTVRLILNDYAIYNFTGMYYHSGYNSSFSCLAIPGIGGAIECIKYNSAIYYSTSIKNDVDTWYDDNITGDYQNYIATSKYCSDYSYNDSYYFGSYYRNYLNKAPSLLCTAPSGYTNGSASSLLLNVGLPTADELALAGYTFGLNTHSNYLYIDDNVYFSMSPFAFDNADTAASIITSSGNLLSNKVSVKNYFRPVINLKNNTLVTGDGTITNPYQIAGLL